MMPTKSSHVVRLLAHLRAGATAATLVVTSAAGVSAAPLTQSFTFGLDPEEPLATFDATQGTLLAIDIDLSYMLRIGSPFNSSPDRIDDWCSATVSGAAVTVSAPGTPTLLASTPSQPVDRRACDSGYFEIIEVDRTSVEPSLFGAFTTMGPSSMTLIITRVLDTVTVTAETPTETRLATAQWLGRGQLTYTYCAAGQNCAMSPVPEPTTAAMLMLGLAGMLTHRRHRRRSGKVTDAQRPNINESIRPT
jgi:hypothetical protein